jgi:hypothetical protein
MAKLTITPLSKQGKPLEKITVLFNPNSYSMRRPSNGARHRPV